MVRENKLTPEKMASVIDHTYLEVDGVSQEKQCSSVEKLVEEAHQWGAFAVCVRESMVAHACRNLTKLSSSVRLAAVIGFPDGNQFATSDKVVFLNKAKDDGAVEFDMVIPFDALKRNDSQRVYDDVFSLSRAAGTQVLKVIFENAYLSPEQKGTAYKIVRKALVESARETSLGVRFFKTSTGFARLPAGSPTGATLEDVRLMYHYTRGQFGIKPAGGVGTFKDALAFFEASGSPLTSEGNPDPFRFRIGSSSLLAKLHSVSSESSGY